MTSSTEAVSNIDVDVDALSSQSDTPAPTEGSFTWPIPGVRVVMDGLQDAIVITDNKGTVHYVNPAAERLFGWPAGDLIGQSAHKLVPESMRGYLSEGFEPFIMSRGRELAGRQLRAVIARRDG